MCSKYQYFILGLYEKAVLKQTPYFGGPLVRQILGSPYFQKLNLVIYFYCNNTHMKGRDHFGHLGTDGKLILTWVLKYDMRLPQDSFCSQV